MFSNCTTLAELNSARVQAVSKYDIVEVNNAYNMQRKKILESRQNFIKTVIKQSPKYEREPMATFIYKGPSSQSGVIEMRADGIYA